MHFVLELIQNADVNSYHHSLLSGTSEEFVVEPSCVSVLNNKVGFSQKNVRAICDVSKSTKGGTSLRVYQTEGHWIPSSFSL